MEKLYNRAIQIQTNPISLSREIQTELVRKSIHLLIALVPFFASLHLGITMSLLGMGTIFYTYAEMQRYKGYTIPVISKITSLASRERDQGRFVLGPVTLGLGAMSALFFYPDPAASIAIFALAFGDGLSSLVGKLLGSIRIPFTNGKTLAGSITCFVLVFLISFRLTGEAGASLWVAATATFLEALPSRDLDNIIIPVGTGFIAWQLFHPAGIFWGG